MFAVAALAVLSLGVWQAQAGVVSCDLVKFSESPGGTAIAEGCDHTGSNEETRLVAGCAASPGVEVSPWAGGSYSNVDFSTGRCAFGVDEAQFNHR